MLSSAFGLGKHATQGSRHFLFLFLFFPIGYWLLAFSLLPILKISLDINDNIYKYAV
jgi:hypothetical protein